MNALINRIFKFFYRYKKLVKLIDAQVTTKTVIKSVLGSILIASIILAPFVLVIANMFIITKLTLLWMLLLLLLVIVWVFLYYFLYYKLLSNYHPKLELMNTNIPKYTESIIASVFFLMIGIIIIMIIV